MLRLSLSFAALLFLGSCSNLKKSTHVCVDGADKSLVQYIPVQLKFNIPEGTVWNSLRIEVVNGRILPHSEIPRHDQEVCPTEGKKCTMKIFQLSNVVTLKRLLLQNTKSNHCGQKPLLGELVKKVL